MDIKHIPARKPTYTASLLHNLDPHVLSSYAHDLPTVPHTHTVIALHSRKTDKLSFRARLFITDPPSHDLPLLFRSWRWVYATTPGYVDPVSQRRIRCHDPDAIPAWFALQSETDVTAQRDLQVGGLKASVESLLNALEEEVRLLGGRAERVVLLGVDIGMDDRVVDVSLGEQAREFLVRMGIGVEWRGYLGLEVGGHWIKVPEGWDDIAAVIEKIARSPGG